MATAIAFEHISKQYRLGLVSTKTLSHDLRRFWITNVLGKEDPYLKIGEVNDRSTKGQSDYVWALRDIDFKVEQGDVLGIIGKNGAGKSTLLKLLSKVTGPTTGTIRAHGRIGSLLEVGTGFHPEMTGRENIFLNGAILGMTRHEIQRKLDEIIDFSGCERYIDTPVKRYSSGMMVRLGFAVAAFLEPEILVVDEVLAVGDAEFQKKAIGKMQDVSKGEGRTVLFVSHNMDSILNLCHTGILLENGQVRLHSKIEDVVSTYLKSSSKNNPFYINHNASKSLQVEEAYFIGTTKNKNGIFLFEEQITLAVKIQNNQQRFPNNTVCGVVIYTSRGVRITTLEYKLEDFKDNKFVVLHFTFPEKLFAPGDYYFRIALHTPNVEVYDDVTDICHCKILDTGTSFLKYNGDNNGCIIINGKVSEHIND